MEKALSDLREERERILALALLQQKLHSELLQKMRRQGIKRDELAQAVSFPKHRLMPFVDKKSVAVGNKFLASMEVFLGCSKLINDVRSLAEPFHKSPKITLALYSPEVIMLAFSIFETRVKAPPVRRETFAAAFGNEQNVVLDVLRKSHTGFEALEEEAVAQSLMDCLTSASLMDDIRELHEKALKDYKEAAVRLPPLMNKLIEHIGGITAVSAELGVHKSKYNAIMRDEPNLQQHGIKDVLEMIELCRKKLAEIEGKQKDTPLAQDETKARSKTREKLETPVQPQKDPYTAEPKRRTNKPALPSEGTHHEVPEKNALVGTPNNKEQFSALVSGVLKSLHGNVEALEALSEQNLAAFRDQDRLNIARAVIRLLDLNVVDTEIFSEALHGLPVEDISEIEDLLSLLRPYRKEKR